MYNNKMSFRRQDDCDFDPDDLIAGTERESIGNLNESNDPSYPQQSSSPNQGKPGRTKGRFPSVLQKFLNLREQRKKWNF